MIIDTFETNETIVEADKFSSVSSVLYGGKRSSLPIDGLRELQLEDDYQFPAVQAEVGSNDELIVSSDNKEVTVESGSVQELELSSRKVQVRRPSQEFKEIPDPKSGGTVKTRKKGPVEIETVRPVLVVDNYGPITVYDGSEVSQ